MPSKRKRQTDVGNEDESSSSYQTSARLDPTYGQRSAFPGLEVNSDPSINPEAEAEEDGLSYLRKVRAEARNVPNLLVAPKERITDPQHLYASRGWYSDGAYTEAPNARLNAKSYEYQNGLEEEEGEYCGIGGTLEEGEVDGYDGVQEENAEDLDPQEAYYTALLQRFATFRTALLTQPPTNEPCSQFNSFSDSEATDLKSKQPQWSRVIRFSAPTASQIASLPQRNVMRGLERLESLLTRKNLLGSEGQGEFLGAWAWALLARCRSIGEMGSEDVAIVRSLGGRAARLKGNMRKRCLSERAAEGSESEAEDEDEGKEVENDIDVADGDLEMGEIQKDDTSVLPGLPNGTHTATDPDSMKAEEALEEQVTQPELDKHDDSTENRIQLELAKRRALLLHAISGAPTNVLGPSSGDMPDQDQATETEIVKSESTGPQTSLPHSISPPHQESDEDSVDLKDLEERAFATLDIVITIVGEVFGQRDLLDAREVWGEFD